jgi:hypothetical protein
LNFHPSLVNVLITPATLSAPPLARVFFKHILGKLPDLGVTAFWEVTYQGF